MANKVLNTMSVFLIVIVNIFIDALFLLMGWNLLPESITSSFSLPYLGWVAVLCFVRLLITSGGGGESYRLDNEKERMGCATAMMTRIVNKMLLIIIMIAINFVI